MGDLAHMRGALLTNGVLIALSHANFFWSSTTTARSLWQAVTLSLQQFLQTTGELHAQPMRTDWPN